MSPRIIVVVLAALAAACSGSSTGPDGHPNVVIDGHVYGSNFNNPVSGAVVSTSLDSQTATTDLTGHFSLQTQTQTGTNGGCYTIKIVASGYPTFSVLGQWGDNPTNQTFILNNPAGPGGHCS